MTVLRNRCFCLFCMVFCSMVGLLAQLPDYHVQLFDESFGIRTDMEQVIKDNKGFIWLSSFDRIFRFDGKAMKEFPFDERIYTIICDRNGSIWANSIDHIYLFKNDYLGFVTIPFDTINNLKIGHLFQLPGKELWVHTSIGFYAWNTTRRQFQFLDFPGVEMPSKISIENFTSCENTLFFTTSDSVIALDVEHNTRMTLPRMNDQGGMYAIGNHELLVTGRAHMTHWCDFLLKKISLIDFKDMIPGDNNDFLFIQDAVPLDQNRVLIASQSGLLELRKDNHTFRLLNLFNKGKPLQHTPYFFDLFYDDDQNIWLIHSNGLLRFSPDKESIGLIRNHESKEPQPWPNNVRNFVEDDLGNLWISTSHGFGYWNLQTNLITMYPAIAGATDRLNQPSVRGLALDENHLIIGTTTTTGVWLYEPKTKKFSRPLYAPGAQREILQRKFEQEFIKQILQLPDGNYLIVARDCYIMDKDNYQVGEFDIHCLTTQQVNICYIGNDKSIWLGTEEGLICYDSTLKYVNDWNLNMSVIYLHEFEGEKWLLGTREGLYVALIRGDSVAVSREDNLSDRSRISFITIDRLRRYWIGSVDGLIRYTPGTKRVELFDYADNIQGSHFSPAPFFNRVGMLFLGGTNGINYFHPEKIEPQEDSLQVSLMNISVNQDDTSYYSHEALLSLRPFQNSIEIEFIAPYYGNTNRLQYQYKLEGLSNKWINVGHNNIVRFTSLSPGHYEFRVAASMNGITWHESDESLLFNIAFPFWQSWWFFTLSIGTIVWIAFFLMKHRIRFIRRQEAERRKREVQLITMNRDLAASQLTALRAQMNPHFIFNALNSVQRYILKGDVDQANKYLSKFSRLQREVLNNSSHDFIPLEKEIEILELYLQLEQLRFDDKFEYNITVDKDIDVNEIKIPPMILQPFIENAIWHGLMPRLGSKKVDIQFLLNPDELLSCRIRDNGIGRAASARLKNNQEDSTVHQSKGLSLVHERLQILEKLYLRPYQVEVVDNMDSFGAVEGTEVTVTLHVGP